MVLRFGLLYVNRFSDNVKQLVYMIQVQ